MSDLFIHREQDTGGTNHLRLTLTRIWNRSLPLFLSCGANPSYADDHRDDMTIHRLDGWGRAWGYGGFIKVNLEPFRSPSPAECQAWIAANPVEARVEGIRNMKCIAEAAARCVFHLVCWGNLSVDRDRAAFVCRLIEERGGRVHCLGLTGNGNPIHPMARGKYRVPNDVTPRPYDWRRYLAPAEPAFTSKEVR